MRRFELARRRGRELRASFDVRPEELQTRLERYLREKHKMTPRALSTDAMRKSKAEVLPRKGQLRYDEALNDKPVEKLFIFAHEAGHLDLHQRHIGPHAIPNPLRDSRFATSDGAGAIARYSPKDSEEVEANAFAKEFVCPADLVFADWRQDPTATPSSLAAKWGASEEIVQIQLAESLFGLFLKSDSAETVTRPHEISLNEAQCEAAEYLLGAAIVDAGPGTGKTSTLVARVDFLLRQKGVAPSHILVLTFSNEAADELRERIELRFDEETANAIEIHTFHSFGHARLLSNAQNLASTFRILDEIAQEELVAELLGKVECEKIITLRDPGETARLAVEQINYLKDRMYGEAELARAITELTSDTGDSVVWQKAEQFLALFREYERAKYNPVKREFDAVDFADMILLTRETFRENAALVTAIRKQYQHVLVDEFQDVSPAMIKLLGQLCGEQNPPWVVGDIRQAIYRFRGAEPDRNLALFKQLFPKARSFDLRSNYRSCEPIINAANQMATLIASPEHATGEYEAFWEVGASHQPFGDPPIQILSANSDAAEQEGIAELVNQWREAGVKAGEIAVLARRNIDVRNIVLTLGRRNIKATTAGLLTPEGAAGDLAAMLTLADAPKASLPRVIRALGVGYESALLNEITGSLLAAEEKDGIDAARSNKSPSTSAADLIAEYERLFDCLHKQKHSSDAFALLCAFLFDGSDYLRRHLDNEDDTRKQLALCEIITTLTRAVDYRFTHPKIKPRESRLGFAQTFRYNLSGSKPITAAPRSNGDVIRVMTCHASKGLEFPVVIVAGQTINKDSRKERDWWLPPGLMPPGEEDRKQADSLLFVGLTRARSAAVITYAEAKTAGGRKRDLPGLLGRWHSCYDIPLKASLKFCLYERRNGFTLLADTPLLSRFLA
jgi:DNA helicase-2/ATP-dependent DNA helicase PcrA